ncbi:hypothetical protein J3E69DRAFT_39008 [Trichoderma sp. SZMC 28015]
MFPLLPACQETPRFVLFFLGFFSSLSLASLLANRVEHMQVRLKFLPRTGDRGSMMRVLAQPSRSRSCAPHRRKYEHQGGAVVGHSHVETDSLHRDTQKSILRSIDGVRASLVFSYCIRPLRTSSLSGPATVVFVPSNTAR